MNDLRSRNRALAAVPDEDLAPTSTPPRVRPEGDERAGRRMSRRQSIAERARRLGAEAGGATMAGGADPVGDVANGASVNGPAGDEEIILAEDGTAVVASGRHPDGGAAGDHMFRSSRPEPAEGGELDAANASAEEEIILAEDGPSSRPTRRRDISDEDGVPEEEDKFPWHFQFDDDEPEELQASSPLLSRAFRASIG